MKTLVIYETVPEKISFYVVHDMLQPRRDALKVINGLYQNSSEMSEEQENAFDLISSLIVPPDGAWVECEVDVQDLNNHTPFDEVYSFGFTL